MDKFTLSNKRLLDFHQALLSVKHLKGAKFGYAVSRTLRSIDPLVKSLQDASQSRAEYIEFRQAAEVLGTPLAVKQGDDPLYDIYNGELFLQIKPEFQSDFKKKYKALKKKYADAIASQRSQQTEFKEILRQDVTIEIYAIPRDLIPEGITFGQAFRILPMIQIFKEDEKLVDVMFPNDLLIDFPSKVLRNFAGVSDRSFILSMLENFRSLDYLFLDISGYDFIVNYNNLYEDGRIKLCEKFTSLNCYDNPQMIAVGDSVEYSIEDSPLYNKAMKLFKGSMQDITDGYELFCTQESPASLSKIKFDQIPDDFSGTQIDLLADLIQE